jgi:transglutaminase-like putative cysteine protease
MESAFIWGEMKKYIKNIVIFSISSILFLFLLNTSSPAGWHLNQNNSPRGGKYYLTPDMRMLAEDIIYSRFYTSEEQLARKIFDWVENNIEYDDSSGTSTASRIFEERKGKCAGQSRLFIALAREFGLNARYTLVDIDCYGKPVKHACAWIRLDGKEYLIDPAYGLFGADHQDWRVVNDRPSRLLLAFAPAE